VRFRLTLWGVIPSGRPASNDRHFSGGADQRVKTAVVLEGEEDPDRAVDFSCGGQIRGSSAPRDRVRAENTEFASWLPDAGVFSCSHHSN